MAAAIREQDPNHLVFYEPVTWGMVLNGNVTGSGLTHAPGGPSERASSVFSVHYYCWLLDAAKGTFLRQACDRALGPQVLRAVARDSAQLGGGVMVTEYGADTCTQLGECAAMADEFALVWLSSIYWPGGGTPRELGLSRPYPRAIAGLPLNTSFARSKVTKDYSFCYTVNRSITEPTEIFVDFEHYYSDGVQVTATPSVIATVLTSKSLVVVQPAPTTRTGVAACISIVGAAASEVRAAV